MGLIALEGMHFYAYHGFYEEEQLLGNNYTVDVYLETLTEEAAVGDDLYATVNYETVYFICQSEMRKKRKLLETLAQAIAERLSDHFESLQGVKVRVRKHHPPLGGRVDSAYVEFSLGSFLGMGEMEEWDLSDLE